MASHYHTSSRILIVGGGISGLSIAVRLAQANLPVTVLEASQLGSAASTRNQGWLYSGAWFAPDQPELARMCHESLKQTLQFCPDCVEADCGGMVYLFENAEADSGRWTAAWTAADIPHTSLPPEKLFERFPELAISRAGKAFELPDRAIRTDVLLRRLAEAAKNAGAEIRTRTSVARLVHRGDSIQGVETTRGETLPARLVVLAGNARGGFLHPGFGTESTGAQREFALMALKTHLVAVQPEISSWPLCVVDAGGFNHVPHPPGSVFGSNRWLPVRDAEDDRADPAEIDRIWEHVRRLFPHVRRDERTCREWAGISVEAMLVEQIEPGKAPLPTVIDHEQDPLPFENLLSVFPGRATLWPHLAEQALQAVARKLEPLQHRIAKPPWRAPANQ